MSAQRFLTSMLCASTLSLLACEQDLLGCQTSNRFGVVLTVRDSISGAGLANQVLAIATGVGGAPTDTLEWFPGGDSVTMAGLYGQPGTFDLTATASGYQPWTRAGIVVEQGVCVVSTNDIEVLLQPD